MNTVTKTVIGSVGVLVIGLALIGSLMFVFATSAQAHQKGAHDVGSKLEVRISDEGKVLVRGAEITAISENTVTARTVWGQSTLVWTVKTDGDTTFVEKDGSGSRIADLSTGEYISFSGDLDESSGAFTVDAEVVKDWSKDGTQSDDDDHEARVEAKLEAKNNWEDWKQKFSLLGWFGNKGHK